MKTKISIQKEMVALNKVNREMNDIFKKHHIKKHFGEEGFWNNVELVSLRSPQDANILMKLAKEWNQHSEKLSHASRGIIKKGKK